MKDLDCTAPDIALASFRGFRAFLANPRTARLEPKTVRLFELQRRLALYGYLNG